VFEELICKSFTSLGVFFLRCKTGIRGLRGASRKWRLGRRFKRNLSIGRASLLLVFCMAESVVFWRPELSKIWACAGITGHPLCSHREQGNFVGVGQGKIRRLEE